MKTTLRFALTFSLVLAACTTLDDLQIPDPIPPADDDEGDDGDGSEGDDDDDDDQGEQDPDPDLPPVIPGAWAPCEGWDDESCSPDELGCFMPEDAGGDQLLGHCTWICDDAGDCADLAVGSSIPQCLPYKSGTSACQLPCDQDDCPEGMACREIEVYPDGQALVCVWLDEVIQ